MSRGTTGFQRRKGRCLEKWEGGRKIATTGLIHPKNYPSVPITYMFGVLAK